MLRAPPTQRHKVTCMISPLAFAYSWSKSLQMPCAQPGAATHWWTISSPWGLSYTCDQIGWWRCTTRWPSPCLQPPPPNGASCTCWHSGRTMDAAHAVPITSSTRMDTSPSRHGTSPGEALSILQWWLVKGPMDRSPISQTSLNYIRSSKHAMYLITQWALFSL